MIRADFGYHDEIVGMFPATFSVPASFTRHMKVVADDNGATEDTFVAARRL